MATTKFEFDFNWKLTLSVFFVFPLLIRLSYWQVERAEEKKALSEEWKMQQEASAERFFPENEYTDYQRVTLRGQFLTEKYWLKENQIFQGQIGYRVIMPFQLEDGLLVVVDRGWVKGAPRRDYVPQIQTPPGNVALSGTLMLPSDSSLIQETEDRVNTWPHKILEVDLAAMTGQSGMSFYQKILRIDADDPAALVVYWRPINSSPAKHYGYAVQWGLMAIALVILYVFASSNLSEWLKSRSK